MTQLGDHTARMLYDFNSGHPPPPAAIVDLLQGVARFLEEYKLKKRVHKDNTEMLTAICSMTHLVKKQSFDIKAIKNSNLKPWLDNPLSYKNAFIRSSFSSFTKLEPAPFKANKIIVKINNLSSSNSLKQTKKTDLVGLINNMFKKKNVININIRAVQKLKSEDLAVQILN